MLKDFVYFHGFKRIPLSGNFYELSCDAVLRETVSRKVIDLVKDEDGVLFIPSDIDEWFSGLAIALVMAITFRNPVMHQNQWRKLELIYKDGDPKNYRLTNTLWKCPEGKLGHNLFPGFCYIPGYSRYLINLEGIVISSSSGEVLNSYTNEDGYLMLGVQPDVGKRTICGQHRLKALAFKPYPKEVDRLDVNHLNGIKDDNELSNLEWATRSRNNNHAYEVGLKKARAVLVRDVITGEITRYYGIEECSRKLDLDGETIRQRILTDRGLGKVFGKRYQFRFEDDSSEWVIKNQLEDYQFARDAKKVRITHSTTGTSLNFDSVVRAAAFFGETRNALGYQLSKNPDGIVYRDHFVEFVS